MTGSRTRRGLWSAVLLVATSGSSAQAAESPAYTAFAQGQYLTAIKLAEGEAEKGSKEAYTLLGEIYEGGLGVAQDLTKAADFYAKGADLGDPNAQFSLGTLAAAGPRGQKGPQACRRLVREGRGSGNASAQYNLALIYLDGKGRPADEQKAVEWMQKAAERGLPVAEYDLGGFYQFGRGVSGDKAKAAEWTGEPPRRGCPKLRPNMA